MSGKEDLKDGKQRGEAALADRSGCPEARIRRGQPEDRPMGLNELNPSVTYLFYNDRTPSSATPNGRTSSRKDVNGKTERS
jgi:hypothetical protein